MSSDRSDNPKVEFAKSGRSKCRGCQEKISKDIPRIGIPSPFTTPKGEVITSYRYYHVKCIPRYAIQDVISFLTKEKLDDSNLQNDTLASLNQMLQTEPSKEIKSEQQIQEPFLEYAKSSRGKCRHCEEKIEKNSLRAAEPALVELDDDRRFVTHKYYHLDCYLNNSNEPKTLINTLIDISLNKQTIDEGQVEEIKGRFSDLYAEGTGVDEILATIGVEAVTFTILRSRAKEQGVKFEQIEKAIDRGLVQGEIFKPTPDTVQKLS